MPYNAKKPDKETITRIKGKYPEATIKDVKQWISVFNASKKSGDKEDECFSKAWGVLKKKFKKNKKKADELISDRIFKLSSELSELGYDLDSLNITELITDENLLTCETPR